MEKWRVHAVKEVHARGGLVNRLELLGPHQCVAGEEMIHGAITHVLRHHDGRVITHPVDVLECHFLHLGCLLYHSPTNKEKTSVRGS